MTFPERPKILISSYPRCGSTTLQLALAESMDGTAVVLHEPFRSQWSEHRRDFGRSLRTAVAQADILKHHPGNLLTDRQNRMLYSRWVDAGGKIVHLRRRDRRAQARSLAIARALNSYHRRHRVTAVPDRLVEPELADLDLEIDHQSELLGEFDHLDVWYEDIFAGDLGSRLNKFESLHEELYRPGRQGDRGPIGIVGPRRQAVARVLSPRRRVQAATGPDVDLVAQVPLFVGCSDLLAGQDRSSIREAIEARAHGTSTGPRYGVRSGELSSVLGSAATRDLVELVAACLRQSHSLHVLVDDASNTVDYSVYEGSTADHDAGVFHRPVGPEAAVRATITVSEPASFDGGDLHVLGRGLQSRSRHAGVLTFFASSFGARRRPVTRGRLVTLGLSLRLSPNQILAAGQLPWAPNMFADEPTADQFD